MNSTYKYYNINFIRSQVDILELISESVQLSLKGSKYWGLCPFHSEKTPSFSVNRGKQTFYCFGCHVGGDIFDYVKLRDGVDFRTACKYIADKSSLNMNIAPAEHMAMQKAQKERDKHRMRRAWAYQITKDQWMRLINIENWCHLFMKHVKNERDMDRPGPVWAAHTLPLVESLLDEMERADATTRLQVALAVRGWRP